MKIQEKDLDTVVTVLYIGRSAFDSDSWRR